MYVGLPVEEIERLTTIDFLIPLTAHNVEKLFRYIGNTPVTQLEVDAVFHEARRFGDRYFMHGEGHYKEARDKIYNQRIYGKITSSQTQRGSDFQLQGIRDEEGFTQLKFSPLQGLIMEEEMQIWDQTRKLVAEYFPQIPAQTPSQTDNSNV